MRLTPEEVAAIKAAAAEVFGPHAVVRLFGSRVHDHLRGGDTDLHFEVRDGQHDYRHEGDFKWELFRRLAPRQVDCVFHVEGRPFRVIDRIAHAEGIVL